MVSTKGAWGAPIFFFIFQHLQDKPKWLCKLGGSLSPQIGLHLSQNQIQALKSQQKFTSCEPKQRVEKRDHMLISHRHKSIGQVFDVADENGKPQAKAKLAECFVTTFGNPDPKLVSGMGFGSDIQKYKTEFSKFWQQNFPREPLSDSTELFVCVWEHV